MTDLGIRLEALFETSGPPQVELPAELETAYGGPFHLPEEVVYANFVSSIDGVAAIAGVEMSSATISGGAPSDRSVMALLRAVADAVVVGSGTLREHGGPWTAERAFPAGADAYRRARAALSLARGPDARGRHRERRPASRSPGPRGRRGDHDHLRRSGDR